MISTVIKCEVIRRPYCAPSIIAMFDLLSTNDDATGPSSEFRRRPKCGSHKEGANDAKPRNIRPRDKIAPLDFTCTETHQHSRRPISSSHVLSLLPHQKSPHLVANLFHRQNVHRSVNATNKRSDTGLLIDMNHTFQKRPTVPSSSPGPLALASRPT